MSRKSDAAERGREAYARWKELSEDEKNEDLRRRLLASDQNNPVVRDMLKTVEKDIRGRSSANGGPTLEYESHGLLALTVPHLHVRHCVCVDSVVSVHRLRDWQFVASSDRAFRDVRLLGDACGWFVCGPGGWS